MEIFYMQSFLTSWKDIERKNQDYGIFKLDIFHHIPNKSNCTACSDMDKKHFMNITVKRRMFLFVYFLNS